MLDLKVTEYDIKADIPTELTFAFVSDLHGCDNAPVMDAVNTVKPDAVLVGGDFIHNNTVYKEGLEFLRRSSGLYPTFCVKGNHELRYEGDLTVLVKETGAVLLDDSSVEFKGINIGGLTSVCYSPDAIPNIGWLADFSEKEGYRLLLCHHPEYFEKYIKERDIHLTLSGHAHGGQWRAFGRGVYAPGQGLFPRYTSGLYDGRLLVGRGIGNPHPVPRINDPPEVIVLRIITESVKASSTDGYR